jgi:glycosyltransferase involved in cell wall biosynthesis
MKLFVSIIIPCRNEEKFIGKCLDSVVVQDYQKENLEVLVVDGMSSDGTREIVKKYIKKYPFIKLLDNSKEIKPCALNIGIKKANGNVIIIMDAHAGYAKNYISKCVEHLEKYKVDNVGGAIKTLPAKNTLAAQSVAMCLSHFFGAGGSTFRVGSKKPRRVDTVFGGCYRKEIFKKVGLFNENLIRSQDMEFNLRLKKAGGKILLAPDIISYYYPKSNLGDFLLHNIQDGIWTVYPLKFVKMPFRLRHYIPLIFVLGLFFSLILSVFSIFGKILFISVFGIYLFLNLFFSLRIALIKGPKYFFIMPMVFFVRHFGYGLGSIWGLIKLYGRKKTKRN